MKRRRQISLKDDDTSLDCQGFQLFLVFGKDRNPFSSTKKRATVVTDHCGQPWQPGRQDVAIANPVLHPKLLSLFAK
jgi:hypothetical protein